MLRLVFRCKETDLIINGSSIGTDEQATAEKQLIAIAIRTTILPNVISIVFNLFLTEYTKQQTVT